MFKDTFVQNTYNSQDTFRQLLLQHLKNFSKHQSNFEHSNNLGIACSIEKIGPEFCSKTFWFMFHFWARKQKFCSRFEYIKNTFSTEQRILIPSFFWRCFLLAPASCLLGNQASICKYLSKRHQSLICASPSSRLMTFRYLGYKCIHSLVGEV